MMTSLYMRLVYNIVVVLLFWMELVHFYDYQELFAQLKFIPGLYHYTNTGDLITTIDLLTYFTEPNFLQALAISSF